MTEVIEISDDEPSSLATRSGLPLISSLGNESGASDDGIIPTVRSTLGDESDSDIIPSVHSPSSESEEDDIIPPVNSDLDLASESDVSMSARGKYLD